MIRDVIYLHGFASSPDSSKAQRIGRELARLGVQYSCPDLNLPSFETLTVTRMLDQTRAAIAAAAPGPVALIGSSLGAFVAAHAAARDMTGTVDRVVLLAPAFDFGGNRLRQLGEHGIDEWRRRGVIQVFHYAWNEPRDVGFALYEDAAQYDAYAITLHMPVLIYQGRRDVSVLPASVENWAEGRTNVDLRMLDDEHQLTASMDEMWAGIEEFLVAPVAP